MTTAPDSVTRVILQRLRIERRRILVFAAFALLVQMVAAVFYFAAEEQTLRLNWLGLLLFPAGWVLPLCVGGYFLRRYLLRRDLKAGPVTLSAVVITKLALDADFDSGTPRDDQHIKLHGQRGRYLVPLEFWNTLPETQCVDCQCFRNSKVMLSLNGHSVWPVEAPKTS